MHSLQGDTLRRKMLSRSEFEKFIREQQEPLRRFLLTLTNGNSSLSDDIAQDSFIKAYRGLNSFQGKSTLTTWLFKIAYNTFINEVSKKQSTKGAIGLDSIGGKCDDINLSPDASVSNKEILKALSSLEGDEKVVIILFYMEEMKIREISKVTGIKTGTIKSHLSRGREHLKKYLITNGYGNN